MTVEVNYAGQHTLVEYCDELRDLGYQVTLRLSGINAAVEVLSKPGIAPSRPLMKTSGDGHAVLAALSTFVGRETDR